MTWRLYRNLENSFKDFLDTSIASDSLVDEKGNAIPVRIGRKNDSNWTIPFFSVYMESETLENFEIGSNLKDDRQLMVLDVYASNEGERLDLTKWLVDIINDGLRYYSYTYNPLTPEAPTAVAGGWVNINFLTNARVNLGQNVAKADAHRHQVTVSVWIS